MCDSCGCGSDSVNYTLHRSGGVQVLDDTPLQHPGLQEHNARSGRVVRVEEDVLAVNNAMAAHNRSHLEERGILALNLVSSPGSGKTTILEQTIKTLNGRFSMAVIEGDQQTQRDAERIRATGVEVVQVNTGTGCHLDADMVHRALGHLDLGRGSLLFIENVGNLVCPALFDLGEAAKVVIISVTEGDDKPEKYPHIFHAADLCLINKTDLLPHVDFNVGNCRQSAKQVNPRLAFCEMSARKGEGMECWLQWLHDKVSQVAAAAGK